MGYVDPASVDSPKGKIRSVTVLHNDLDKGWAVAEVDYENEPRIGLRWNGWEGEPGIGNPQSRGHPTWFLVPAEFEDVVRQRAEELAKDGSNKLRDGYRAMARDRAREAEAADWTEGLIGDAGNPKG